MKPPALAERLAACGIPSFPCARNKKPTTERGFLDATADNRAMEVLWRRHPGPLVGVPTGPRSGFDVLDIDPRHGGDQWLMEHQNTLPTTRVHRTRSGGEHWLFTHSTGVRNSIAKLASGVDVRGDGGYIIWWPGYGGAITCGAKATAWPAWLLALVLAKPVDDAPLVPWRQKLAGDATTARRTVQRQLACVASAPPGERHYRLRNAALLIGGILASDKTVAEGDVAAQLYSAIREAGGDDVCKANAEKTIAWGLQKGAAKPLRIVGKNG